jgi:hypothetical protein
MSGWFDGLFKFIRDFIFYSSKFFGEVLVGSSFSWEEFFSQPGLVHSHELEHILQVYFLVFLLEQCLKIRNCDYSNNPSLDAIHTEGVI